MLKFENVKVGSLIRTYVFEHTKEHYIDGIVTDIVTNMYGFKSFLIMVDYSSDPEKYSRARVGEVHFVPMELVFDWDDRVIVLDEPQSEVA